MTVTSTSIVKYNVLVVISIVTFYKEILKQGNFHTVSSGHMSLLVQLFTRVN